MRETIQDIPASVSAIPAPEASPPIGQLTLVHGARWVVATLKADMRWHCDDPDVVTMLRRASGVEALVKAMPDLDAPTLQRLGRHAMYRAACRVRGRVTLPTAPATRDLQLAGL